MCKYNLLNGYIGSKAPYVAKIKSLFDPTCTKYVEPFAGSAAIYFSNYNGKYQKEWINEINPNVVVLYKALEENETREETIEAILDIDKNDDESTAREKFRRAQRDLLGENVKIGNDKNMYVEAARRAYIAYSQSFNCGTKSYSKLKKAEKYKWETRRNLMNAVERLKTHPLITQVDGVEVIKKVKNKSEVQIFCDWPYVGLYRDDPNLYLSEMSGLYAHILGAQELKDCEAAVVMCDYRSQYEGVPTIYDAILGDDWHCFKLADTYKHCQVVEPGQAKRKAQEFVWTNRVPKNAGMYLSMVDYKEKITMDEYWEKIKEACINRRVPDKHIREYETVYIKLYGKSLFSENN